MIGQNQCPVCGQYLGTAGHVCSGQRQGYQGYPQGVGGMAEMSRPDWVSEILVLLHDINSRLFRLESRIEEPKK